MLAKRSSDSILIVPVVVHVIHHSADPIGVGTNISNAQAISAVDNFNDQMINNAPGDPNIRLCIAEIDPNGNFTNGIDRQTWTSFYESHGIYGNTTGEFPQDMAAAFSWPKQNYYNIYVVTEIDNNEAGGGIQGMAYPPTASEVDGTYILHNAIGVVGNLKSYTNQNKTFVHEIGHGMNLYHTFQSTSSCTSETNCTTQGDRLCDTPPHVQGQTCNSATTCPNAPVHNHMSYGNQNCRYEFTPDGIDRMRAALIYSPHRNTLLTSNVCTYVDTGEYDCNGYWNGVAYIDSCGTCVGGNTELEPCVQDCAGMWGGDAFIDDCGDCVTDYPCFIPCLNDVCEDAHPLPMCIAEMRQNYNCTITVGEDLPTTPNVSSNCLQTQSGIERTDWYKFVTADDVYVDIKATPYFAFPNKIYMAIFKGECDDLELIWNSVYWGCSFNFLDYWQPPMTMLPPSGVGWYVTSPNYFDGVFPFVAGTYHIAIYPSTISQGEYEFQFCPLNVLPVELVDFNVEKRQSYDLVNWNTATETNNDYYSLYVGDGVNFELVDKINGAGNSSTPVSYQYKNYDIQDGTYYYQLKQVDFNGEFQEFGPVSITRNSTFTYRYYDTIGRFVGNNKDDLELNMVYIRMDQQGIREKYIKFK